jgi:hypothetical protein
MVLYLYLLLHLCHNDLHPNFKIHVRFMVCMHAGEDTCCGLLGYGTM